MRVASSVTGGVLINAVTSNTDILATDGTDPNPDEDGDGIPDLQDTAASITSYGRAPGLLVGGASAMTLGNVGVGLSAYGLVIKGTVVGQGLFDTASTPSACRSAVKAARSTPQAVCGSVDRSSAPLLWPTPVDW